MQAFVDVGQPSTATSALVALAPGHTYIFQVRPRDLAGNWSAYTTGPAWMLSSTQETGTDPGAGDFVSYTGAWTSDRPAGAFGGGTEYATGAGASATFTFTGRAVAWVAPKSAADGVAKLYLDGASRPVASVDLGSTTALVRQVVFTRRWSSSGPHTLRVEVAGTSGRPRVDVDAFLTMR